MKTYIARFEFLGTEIKQRKIMKIFVVFLMLFLFHAGDARAQSSAANPSMNDLISNWILGGLGLVFTGLVIFIINNALSVLNENGRTIEFSFPMFKGMAEKGKTVGILILILVITGIVLALNYGT